MAFIHTYTPHIKSTCVVCCMPKTYGVLLPHFSTIHSFSTLIITLFTIALIKYPVCLYSTFYLLFFPLVILTCTCHFLITLEHSQNHSVYKVLQVILLFVYVTRNTADVTTLSVNSLMWIFAGPVLNTLLHGSTLLKKFKLILFST